MGSAIPWCEEATSPASWFLFGTKPYKGGGLKDDQLYFLPMRMSEGSKFLSALTLSWFFGKNGDQLAEDVTLTSNPSPKGAGEIAKISN